ncbi:MAG: iron-containing redox enzyme family protein [Alphaproteobacteria bacterium]|nr:iron-containing redox enzyme family protein [Alphaproteobacteria bacterium]
MWRELFSYSLNPEVYFDAYNLWKTVSATELYGDDLLSFDKSAQIRLLAEKRWLAFTAQLTEHQQAIACAFLMEQSAPMAAALGATVHNLSAPGVFESPLQLRAMALLADDVGAGTAHRSRANAFRTIARIYDIPIATHPPRELSQDRGVNDQMFRLPATLLALSRRSDWFGAELIGADFALRKIGRPLPWTFAARVFPSPEWSRLDMASPQIPEELTQNETPIAISYGIVKALVDVPNQRNKINNGIGLFLDLYNQWDQMLYDLTVSRLDSRLSVALLLQSKAREASVYHDNFKLDGRTVREWFNQARTDPLPLVDALAESNLIHKGSSRNSPFIAQLLQYGGPMFRIFTESEMGVLCNWIDSLGREDRWDLPESRADVLNRLSAAFATPRSRIAQGAATEGITPTSIRQAYFTLQGRALAPTTKNFAIDYCDFWLGKAEACVDKTDRSLPPLWQPGLLREWLLDRHDRHAECFEASFDSKPPNREAIIKQALQLAPLTLIDGAWLQGFTDIMLATTNSGARLFRTYWDELGNGNWLRNHPKVYRDLLAAMNKELPPTATLDFAFHKDFDDEDFRLPVFWLAIGKFPMRYRAEILGLNLAMELSGVGGTYRTTHRFLQHYNLPTAFVDLHNTIDNVSDGHAAWAADAIDLYISNIESPDNATIAWKHIRKGFEALEPMRSICGSLDYFRARPQKGDREISAADALHHTTWGNA